MLSFNLEAPAKGRRNISESVKDGFKIYTLNYPCQSNSDCTPYSTTLPPGNFKFEVFGASGGNEGDSGPGGLGGYSVGYYEVISPITAYFFVGGRGSDGIDYIRTNMPGGYNGGGEAGFDSISGWNGGSGGGGTDIRIPTPNIPDRIIVAGGGGGGAMTYPNNVVVT